MQEDIIIKRLPENVINQIKAGEVIERPFHVVKELVENSLDAGATAIKVELLDGGKRYIQISDNGSGISQKQIHLAIERHTTSKLSTFEDLQTLQSFGFRGEALASIASISKFSVKSKTTAEPLGHETVFEQGKQISGISLPMSIGTIITVKDIFQNVPVRLKFLKSTGTELAHIQEFLQAISLANFQVSFQFIHNGRVIFDQKGKNSRTERFQEMMGLEAQNYVEIKFQHGKLELSGYAILPEKIRTAQASFITFVNGRFVKDKCIRAGVLIGYQGLLMKGISPHVILFVQVDPKTVDVNAHPSKTEIRFFDPLFVQDCVSRAIADAVKTQLTDRLLYARKIECRNPDNPVYVVNPSHDRNFKEENFTPANCGLTYGVNTSHVTKIKPIHRIKEPIIQTAAKTDILFKAPEKKVFSHLKFLNQFAQCYLIFENEAELWFVDQHAFHERILFEEILNDHKNNRIAKQVLLNPVLIPLNHFAIPLVDEYSKLLGDLGFEIEILNNQHIAVHSFPSFLNQKYIESTLVEMIGKLENQELLDMTAYHHCFSTMACHEAIRAGEQLNEDFVKKLMNRAYDVDFFAHCPHGRPVIRKFSQNDVARWFERI